MYVFDAVTVLTETVTTIGNDLVISVINRELGIAITPGKYWFGINYLNKGHPELHNGVA